MSAVTTTICDSFPDVEKKLIAKVLHFDVIQRVLKKSGRIGDDSILTIKATVLVELTFHRFAVLWGCA